MSTITVTTVGTPTDQRSDPAAVPAIVAEASAATGRPRITSDAQGSRIASKLNWLRAGVIRAKLRACLRTVSGGILTMALTYAIGILIGKEL